MVKAPGDTTLYHIQRNLKITIKCSNKSTQTPENSEAYSKQWEAWLHTQVVKSGIKKAPIINQIIFSG